MSITKDFIEIIKENEGILYKVTKVYAVNNEDQKDLYQEVVYQLWKSYGGFKNKSKISTWIYRVALNTSITYVNKTKKYRPTTTIDFDIGQELDPNDEIKHEQINLLYAHIKGLSVVEKGIILLYLEGKSHVEISDITGFSPTNVGTRINRIKIKLRTQITQN